MLLSAKAQKLYKDQYITFKSMMKNLIVKQKNFQL